jgi:hypothetical protein
MSAPFDRIYAAIWGVFLVWATVLFVRDRRAHALVSRDYARFLLAPWKVSTFVVAGGFFVVAAPYTGDPTWDRVDGAMMAILTFLTAPWSVGVLYRVGRKKLPNREAIVALALWLFSASFCYDAYLWIRDGQYPITWWSNMLASSVLYLCAGLFWNVTYRDGRGVIFAFMVDDWLSVHAMGRGRWKVFAVAALFAAIVTGMMLPFALTVIGR